MFAEALTGSGGNRGRWLNEVGAETPRLHLTSVPVEVDLPSGFAST